MGIFWDLIQQSEIQEQSKKAKNLEERVLILEKELSETKTVFKIKEIGASGENGDFFINEIHVYNKTRKNL